LPNYADNEKLSIIPEIISEINIWKIAAMKYSATAFSKAGLITVLNNERFGVRYIIQHKIRVD
jgi:hypothetical protein